MWSRLATTLTLALALVSATRITWDDIQEKAAQGLHLISAEPGQEPVWMSEHEIDALIAEDHGFFDVTDTYTPHDASRLVVADQAEDSSAVVAYPIPSRQVEVRPLVASLSLSTMESYLTKLTAFNTRWYTSTTGRDSAYYIRDTIADIIATYPSSPASVALFNHTWLQPSVIATVRGSDPSLPITVLGSHFDSVNSRNSASGRAPGADDDASGTINLMEAFRALLARDGGWQPRSTVEFQWYAAEEAGLRGSQAIATAYKRAGTQVQAMFQLDMTAYVRPGSSPIISLLPDFADRNLNNFIGSIISTYTTTKWEISPQPCGYGCSDHASWYNQGYPTAYPFESREADINPVIHTDRDTVTQAGFNLTHSLEFAKVAAAFAFEISS